MDKISALAGMARTSEIMNVEYLVVNDKSYARTDEFKGISVSSEKWFPVYEVTKENLMDYLRFQKHKNGYKIIGLEAGNKKSSRARYLNKFTFPKKTLVLVGDEQEGIPAEYLVDCVD